MEQLKNLTHFADDAEKMIDFKALSKEEFLLSYSYLTEEEYDKTAEYCKSSCKMAVIAIVEAVDRALEKYTSENIDVIRNEETGKLDVIYHSDNNSFPIEQNFIDPLCISKEHKEALIKELNKRNVGYCW